MSGQIAGHDLLTTSTTALLAVGTWHVDPLGRFWQYAKGAATIAVSEYVKVSGDGLFTLTSLTTTTNPSTEPASVGNTGVAFTSTLFGWVFRGNGLHTGKFAASCVQDVKIYTTATAGVVDDAATTLVSGLKLITTITTAAASPAFATGLLQTSHA